ncbi:hypothetical protein PIB30_002939 [Stylosanthes scabra]|uniref:Uncharacterized protein n=1 Tax=Stylosanthes scabra TaxID=79078 RepID=A0ABU6V3G9_9FABA|nr:hypothetical protein [Stylosanthes scabra]
MLSPNKKNKKKEKTKKNVKQGQWRSRSLLVARPHDLKLPKSIITGATARPNHLNGAPARLAHPRDGLGARRGVSLATFGRSYISVWRVRASFLARAQPCIHAIAMARPRPSTWCSRTNYRKGRVPAPL